MQIIELKQQIADAPEFTGTLATLTNLYRDATPDQRYCLAI